jgi:glycosyltransferase involved in cell wall biosynthesis
MKIAYLASTLQRTGPTRQLLNMVRRAQSRHLRAIVVTLSAEPKDSLLQEFLACGTDVLQLNLSRWATLGRAGRVLRDVCAVRQVELVHSQGIRGDGLSALYLNRCARVATIRNIPWYDYAMTYGRIRGMVMARVHLSALSKLDRVVTVSDAVARALSGKLDNLSVIRNGVDVAYYDPDRLPAQCEVRARLGIRADATVFVAVGHLSERKDPRTLLHAFRSLDNDGCILILIGDGPLRAECESLSSASIRLMGRQSDVRPYLRAADVFVSSSTAEGFPNAALEAASMGLPLLLSDIAPHRELAEIDGIDCALFAVGDRAALAERLAQRRATRTLQPINRRVAIAELDMGRTGDRYLDLYAQTIALRTNATP